MSYNEDEFDGKISKSDFDKMYIPCQPDKLTVQMVTQKPETTWEILVMAESILDTFDPNIGPVFPAEQHIWDNADRDWRIAQAAIGMLN